jgi:pseudaminic acid cytidylyltransferase
VRVAIIPARGGSKRIPRKNIKVFGGQPIINWTISTAIESGCFDRVLVSTDDEEIAAIASGSGAEVPFMRPPDLSTDHVSTQAVVAHAINWLCEKDCYQPIEICCLYATAPFIRVQDLQLGLSLLREQRGGYVFPVTSFPYPIQRALRLNHDRSCEMFDTKYAQYRSQDVDEAYHDAGQFYWALKETWLSREQIFSKNSRPIVIPRRYVQDIDTPEDWDIAELMGKVLLRRYESRDE